MVVEDWGLRVGGVPGVVRRQWRADRALRPAMRSPGRPEPSRAVQRQFWRIIATGVTTAEAATMVGVSVPVGSRWFRHAGGMPPIRLSEPNGRYLSFEEREEIAILRAKGAGSVPSRVLSVVIPVPCHGSYGVMPPRGAGNCSTGPRWPSGRPSKRPNDPRPRNWLPIPDYGSTSKTVSRAGSPALTARLSPGPPHRLGRV